MLYAEDVSVCIIIYLILTLILVTDFSYIQ